MKRKMLVVGAILALLAASLMPTVALADDETITVTATGSYVDISVAGGAWTLNSGNPIVVDDWYYTNPLGETTIPSDPVVDGECTHTITNDGSVAVDITVKWDDMSGTGDPWVNSDDATNGSMIFGAAAQASGTNWGTPGGGAGNAVFAMETGPYETLVSNLAASGTKDVVFGFYSPSAFTDVNSKSGDITLTATEIV